jgi:hypothetical protein
MLDPSRWDANVFPETSLSVYHFVLHNIPEDLCLVESATAWWLQVCGLHHQFIQCVRKVAVHLYKVLEVMSTSVCTELY